MTLYSNESEWNMGTGYYVTVNQVLNICFDCRMNKDPFAWFGALEGLWNMTSPLMSLDVQKRLDEMFMEGRRILFPEREEFAREEEEGRILSEAHDHNNLIERQLYREMHKKGMLMPRKINPEHAAAQLE